MTEKDKENLVVYLNASRRHAEKLSEQHHEAQSDPNVSAEGLQALSASAHSAYLRYQGALDLAKFLIDKAPALREQGARLTTDVVDGEVVYVIRAK